MVIQIAIVAVTQNTSKFEVNDLQQLMARFHLCQLQNLRLQWALVYRQWTTEAWENIAWTFSFLQLYTQLKADFYICLSFLNECPPSFLKRKRILLGNDTDYNVK